METRIQEARGPTTAESEVEIVERKGLGHPDTICDAVMERVSCELARAYLHQFGRIPHYNCDKGLLLAGQVELRLGGGRVVEPMRFILGDRATRTLGGKSVDVAEVATGAAKGWFRENLRRIDADRHVHYEVALRPGSAELAGLFEGREGVLGANDTSAAVGFAPLTETERLVREAERHLNSSAFKRRFPQTGEDVKVMGVRRGRQISLTASMPLLDSGVESEAAYFRIKESAAHDLHAHLIASLRDLDEIDLSLNHLDRRGAGVEGMYLSVLGTSAEHGDSGEVGRGNDVTGLISMNRPQSSEAAAGKNPVSHVGKIYSVLAHRLAAGLVERVRGLREVTVWMASRIGDRVDQPWLVSVQAHLQRGFTLSDVAGAVQDGVAEEVAGIPAFCRELVAGRHPVC